MTTMRTLIYSVGVSADGYINGPDGSFGWAAPDDELHRFHNQQTAEVGVHLLGRRMYEQMLARFVALEKEMRSVMRSGDVAETVADR